MDWKYESHERLERGNETCTGSVEGTIAHVQLGLLFWLLVISDTWRLVDWAAPAEIDILHMGQDI